MVIVWVQFLDTACIHTTVVEVLVTGYVVSDVVVGLPAAKQRKSWLQFQLYTVIRLMHVTC